VVNIGNAFRTEKLGAGRYGVRGGCYYACRVRSLFNGKVQLRQHIPRPSVVSALREADLLVHPSTRETSPLVILEAMAAGLPWVAFDAGNVREFPGGVVVRNLHEMAQWSTKLLGEPDFRSRLGQEGRTRIRASHSWETIIDKYEELYYQVWQKKHFAKVS